MPWLLQAPLNSDSDLSVVGLMAAHISQGLHFPVYMYGQGYMGAGEAYLAALFFKLFGRSLAVQSAASLALFALFAWLNWLLVARRSSPREGLAALALTALAPPAMAWWFASGFGGYCAVLVFGAAALLVWFRLMEAGPGRGLGAALAGAALTAGGLWTYTVFWLFILPTLFLGGLTLGGAIREVWRDHPRIDPGRRAGYLARAVLVLGLMDLAHALAVGLGGLSYRWTLAGVHLISPSPQTALGEFLPRGLALVLLGAGLILLHRCGLLGLRMVWRKARPHPLWFLACLAGFVLARLVYDLGLWSMADYAPFKIWPSLGFNGWEGITQRWILFGQGFVRLAFGLKVPGVGVWAAWVLFLPLLASLLLTGFGSLRAVFSGRWGEWLRANRLELVFALSAAGLLAAMLLTKAAVDQVGYRYLLLLVAWWPFLLVRLTFRLGRLFRPAGWALGGAVLGLLIVAAGHTLLRDGAWTYTPDRAVYASLEELMAEAGVVHGRADYWVAYNATNLTHERLILTPGIEFKTSLVRYLDHDQAVARARRKAYVFRRAYDWRDLERIQADFTARRRYFSWLENKDWIILVVEGPDRAGG